MLAYMFLHLSTYNYLKRIEIIAGFGGDLRVYLAGLSIADNVQTYVAQHPFGQGAINETNPYWGFYSEVLHSFHLQSDKEYDPLFIS